MLHAALAHHSQSQQPFRRSSQRQLVRWLDRWLHTRLPCVLVIDFERAAAHPCVANEELTSLCIRLVRYGQQDAAVRPGGLHHTVQLQFDVSFTTPSPPCIAHCGTPCLQTCLPSLVRHEQHRCNGTVSTFFKKVKEGIDR